MLMWVSQTFFVIILTKFVCIRWAMTYAVDMIMPEQSRAARGLLDWSQEDLAEKSGLSLSTIRNFEKGRASPYTRNMEAIRAALERVGIEFLAPGSPSASGGPGVRLKRAKR